MSHTQHEAVDSAAASVRAGPVGAGADRGRAPLPYERGLAHLGQGRWAEAASEFREVRRLDPKDAMRYGPFRAPVSGAYGRALLRLGKLDEDEAELSLAVQYEPQNAEYRGKLGLLYARQSRWDEAEEQLRKAVKFDPDNNEYRNNLKVVLAKQGK